MAQNKIHIKNKKASFEFYIITTFEAGLVLAGTEIKSIRSGKANLNDGFCVFVNDELFVRAMHISEYELGTHYNHDPKRDRKLLLQKRELKKLQNATKEKGFTIIPTLLYINEKGFAKLQIAVAKGKKLFDKRETLKKKDAQREIDRKSEN